jgi:hypothetical protein
MIAKALHPIHFTVGAGRGWRDLVLVAFVAVFILATLAQL